MSLLLEMDVWLEFRSTEDKCVAIEADAAGFCTWHLMQPPVADPARTGARLNLGYGT